MWQKIPFFSQESPRYLLLRTWAAALGCLCLVKSPFRFPATRCGSCFVMKFANIQSISPMNSCIASPQSAGTTFGTWSTRGCSSLCCSQWCRCSWQAPACPGYPPPKKETKTKINWTRDRDCLRDWAGTSRGWRGFWSVGTVRTKKSVVFRNHIRINKWFNLGLKWISTAIKTVLNGYNLGPILGKNRFSLKRPSYMDIAPWCKRWVDW